MLLTAHYCACVWYIIGHYAHKNKLHSWIEYILEEESKDDIDDVHLFTKYSYSIYWSIITLLRVDVYCIILMNLLCV